MQLKTQGTIAGHVAVSGRLVLERYNLADTRPDLAATDEYLKRTLRAHFALVYQPQTDLDTADESALMASLSARPGQGKA